MADRWEHGSEYAFPELPTVLPQPWLPEGATYWHSGRDALRAILDLVRPRRMFFPSYYCRDVLEVTDASIHFYPDRPGDRPFDPTPLELRDDDAILVQNLFGSRDAASVTGAPSGGVLIEDHTHDPLSDWSRASRATYAFSSLRKWLPLPDGAVVWSPQRQALPVAPVFDPEHQPTAARATLDRLSAMLLKRAYLLGAALSKDDYRTLYVGGEQRIGQVPSAAPMSPSSHALLALLPAREWRARRADNHAAFVAAFGTPRNARVISRAPAGGTSYCVVIETAGSEVRERVRSELIARKVYPAVLWPIDAGPGVPPSHVELSRRILCLHCDHRYTPDDLARVAQLSLEALADS